MNGTKQQSPPQKSMANTTPPGIKMVRYRLDVGGKHQVTPEEIKKVLIEESGVDKNNINNLNIHGDYTLVELPDEMPQDIFLHLKSVEVKQHKLDIRRVKARNKKRGNNYRRRGKKSDKGSSDQVSGAWFKPDHIFYHRYAHRNTHLEVSMPRGHKKNNFHSFSIK